MTVSCHSFAALARACEPHLSDDAALMTMSYLGADEAIPHYGLMGPVKAALEAACELDDLPALFEAALTWHPSAEPMHAAMLGWCLSRPSLRDIALALFIGMIVSTISSIFIATPLLAQFKAVQNGNVWCTAQSLFQQSMELPDLILDMNRVFTEGTPADSELTFLTHVE